MSTQSPTSDTCLLHILPALKQASLCYVFKFFKHFYLGIIIFIYKVNDLT